MLARRWTNHEVAMVELSRRLTWRYDPVENPPGPRGLPRILLREEPQFRMNRRVL